MKVHIGRRLLFAALVVFVLFSCLLIAGDNEVRAEGTDDPREYVTVEQGVFETYINSHKAPVKEGYLFAGWVARKSDGTGIAIESKDDAILKEDGVTITAKFIPAHLTGVACQVKSNTYNDGVEETELRVVSLVDDGTYKEFGFNLYRRLNGDPNREYLIVKEGAGNATATTERYSGMYANGERKTPADIFGADAEKFYFTTVRIGGIPKRVYDTCIFIIKPYWVTADGTYVEGMGEYNRVSDGKNGIVNISINFKEAAAIAAGILSVGFDKDKYTFVGYDIGRVFEEMQAVASEETVNCVGNVADMHDNSTNPNDIFINLRFTKNGTINPGSSTFSILSDSSFSNKDEQDVAFAIWDIIH